MNPMAGQVAVVTGGARGLGLGFALRLGELGARVAVIDVDLRSAEGVDEPEARLAGSTLEAALGAVAVDIYTAQADAEDAAAMRMVIAAIFERWGRVDVLVCNAGGVVDGGRSHASELTADEVEGAYRRNVTTAVNVVSPTVPIMKNQSSGKIITLSSLAGISAYNDGSLAAYAMAKAAVVQYTRYLAQELGPHGITANVIAPGPTLTSRFTTINTPEHLGHLARATALRRLAAVDDVVGILEFLSSRHSDYITGQVISVDGGHVRGPR